MRITLSEFQLTSKHSSTKTKRNWDFSDFIKFHKVLRFLISLSSSKSPQVFSGAFSNIHSSTIFQITNCARVVDLGFVRVEWLFWERDRETYSREGKKWERRERERRGEIKPHSIAGKQEWCRRNLGQSEEGGEK